jgi:hypothetical protein
MHPVYNYFEESQVVLLDGIGREAQAIVMTFIRILGHITSYYTASTLYITSHAARGLTSRGICNPASCSVLTLGLMTTLPVSYDSH